MPDRRDDELLQPASVVGDKAVQKAMLRLMPFLFLLFMLNFLDRVNISFAALRMNADLKMSPEAFGLGASIFFIGYFIFEIPSNLILVRVGARLWIARIMVTWGAVSMAMALVQDEWSFYAVRFLLGVAEAGFIPGIVYYLSNWLPAKARAANLAKFMMSSAISAVIGAPISGFILSLDTPLGMANWKLLFIVEGLLTVIVGFLCLRVLVDGPGQAPWLTTQEKSWFERTIAGERVATERGSAWESLADARVWLLAIAYACGGPAFFGIIYWLPQIMKQLTGLSVLNVSLLSALPFAGAAIAMWLNGRHSDATGERTWHLAGSALVGAAGLAIVALVDSPVVQFAGLCVAAIGVWGQIGVFWTVPMQFLSGAGAAAAFALINSVGNVGGFIGPWLIGWVRGTTGSFSIALLVLAALLVAGAVLIVVTMRVISASSDQRSRTPDARDRHGLANP